jgi:hypothetical protein
MVHTLQLIKKSVSPLIFMPFNFTIRGILAMIRMKDFLRRREVGSAAPVSKKLLIVESPSGKLLSVNLLRRRMS